MRAKVALIFLFIFVAVFGTSVQDGFNFYKALNRTPVSRVERVYRDGSNSRYKVPLTKRLFYNENRLGISEQKEAIEKQNEEFIALLFNWNPDIIRSNLPLRERKEEKCIEVENVIPNFE